MSSTATDTATAVKPNGSPEQFATKGERYLAERRFLSGNATDAIARFAHYPEAIRQDGIWLFFFVRARCNGEHAMLAKIARALGLRDRSGKEPSDQYWYQVAGGHYFRTGGDVDAFKRYVNAFRGYQQRMEQTGSIPFIETRNWTLYRDYVDSRRTFSSSCRIGAIEGETGSQKTFCGKHYEYLNNHAETVHLESPARASRARIVHKWAARYLATASASIGEKELVIENWLRGVTVVSDDPMDPGKPRCVIFDNIQRLLRRSGTAVRSDQQDIFSFFHELQDDLGFCMIFTWVPTFRRVITSNDAFWAQFLGRIGGEDEILRLETALPKRDIAKFARAYRVADDAACFPLLKKWSSTYLGIRPFIKRLEKARALATTRKSPEVQLEHLQAVDLEPVAIESLKDEEGES